jgi:hypothetical protein
VSASDVLIILTGLSRALSCAAVLLQNQNWDMTLWPTVGFPHATAATVVEVDPEHGTEAVVLDDSPYMPGLQLSFTAGGARLLILPKTAAAIGA